MPALGTALLGLLAGLWMRAGKPVRPRRWAWPRARLLAWPLGYLWSLWFPLNKNLWTSSFVLVAAGWSLAVLTLAFWAVEEHGWGKGQEQRAGLPLAGLRLQCHHGVHVQRAGSGILSNIHFTAGGRSGTC